ncbi:hypothetical protein KSP40_PGU007786 [Platanthera guangdongensis]|uniref:LisH domain-containing protein n=1 Tax=Platanthera guangdongensis TaxID=2320717 RepID=A0ABR2LJV7_9ASPA
MVFRPQMDGKTTPSSLTSTELNLLVFRYLTESGFAHAAFSVGYEAGINRTNMDATLIPPGALITIVQKGLQYIEMEANLECDDDGGDYDYSFLQILDLITKDVNELQRIIKEKNEHRQKERDTEKERHQMGMKKWQKKRSARKVDKDRDRKDEKIGPEPMDISPSSLSRACEFFSSEVNFLEGHVSEVFSCAWSPVGFERHELVLAENPWRKGFGNEQKTHFCIHLEKVLGEKNSKLKLLPDLCSSSSPSQAAVTVTPALKQFSTKELQLALVEAGK